MSFPASTQFYPYVPEMIYISRNQLIKLIELYELESQTARGSQITEFKDVVTNAILSGGTYEAFVATFIMYEMNVVDDPQTVRGISLSSGLSNSLLHEFSLNYSEILPPPPPPVVSYKLTSYDNSNPLQPIVTVGRYLDNIFDVLMPLTAQGYIVGAFSPGGFFGSRARISSVKFGNTATMETEFSITAYADAVVDIPHEPPTYTLDAWGHRLEIYIQSDVLNVNLHSPVDYLWPGDTLTYAGESLVITGMNGGFGILDHAFFNVPTQGSSFVQLNGYGFDSGLAPYLVDTYSPGSKGVPATVTITGIAHWYNGFVISKNGDNHTVVSSTGNVAELNSPFVTPLSNGDEVTITGVLTP